MRPRPSCLAPPQGTCDPSSGETSRIQHVSPLAPHRSTFKIQPTCNAHVCGRLQTAPVFEAADGALFLADCSLSTLPAALAPRTAARGKDDMRLGISSAHLNMLPLLLLLLLMLSLLFLTENIEEKLGPNCCALTHVVRSRSLRSVLCTRLRWALPGCSSPRAACCTRTPLVKAREWTGLLFSSPCICLCTGVLGF